MNNHVLRNLAKYVGLRSYQQYLSAWAAEELSTLEGSGATFGDFMAYTSPTTPGSYVVALDDSGVFTITSSGDEGWQYFDEDLYSILLRDWTGSVTNYVNPHTPTLFNPLIGSLTASAAPDAPLTIDMNAQFVDQDLGDSLVITISPDTEDQLPDTLTMTSGVISGTAPALESRYDVLIRATDESGLYVELLVTIISGLDIDATGAVYVLFKKMRKFPEVVKVYNQTKSGRLWEIIRAGTDYSRRNTDGAATGWQNAKVDVTRIPGVPPLRASGRPF